MKYTGQFKTINDNLIEINIITENDQTNVTYLTFAGESPVVISQVSSDGVFSPIKSRSCTISIVTKSVYMDMYSASSHGTTVEVLNLTTNQCLFWGYLTPCEYNQTYVYLNRLELEAVDAISSLKDFKYSYFSGNTSRLVSIESVIKRGLTTIAGYTGGIYMPKNGFQSKSAYDSSLYPTEGEYISEEAFFDDDDPLSWYEILEEICNFYNFTAVPIGNDVYFIDYESITNYDYFDDHGKTTFKNIINDASTQLYVPKKIVKGSYIGDDQNLEIDEVYNKVSIKCDTIKLEDDDLVIDPIDEASSSTFWRAIISDMQRSDGQLWKSRTRFFEFIHGSYGSWIDSSTRWQTVSNVNSTFSGMSFRLTDNFSNRQITLVDAWMEFPYKTGYLFNNLVGQTALISQQFNYQASKKVPSSASWSPFVMFFPQAEWIDRWLLEKNNTDSPEIYNSSYNTSNYWLNDFYNNHMGGLNPVLVYRGNKDIAFSPADASTTNYLMFQGDLCWQQNCSYDDVNYHLWSVDLENKYYGGSLFMIRDCGASGTHTCNGCERSPGATDYNKGWPMLKMRIKIGEKYWNGSSWTTVDSICWIPYHKENVEAGNEELIWSDFNHPVSNLDYTYGVRKDGYAIPITKADKVYGKINIDIWMPRIPYTPDVLYGQRASQSDYYLRLNYEKTPPVIFMKDMSFSLESASNDTEHWYLDFSDVDDEDDDIIYSNEIDTNNVDEFDDLTLKINTYNEKVKISQSYIIEDNIYHTDGFYRPLLGTTERQEMNVVNRYVDHYSSPKIIYNCQVHGYIEPWCSVKTIAIKNRRFIVDEQEYDVKSDVNSVKLVQYGGFYDDDSDYVRKYLTFTALDDCTFSFSQEGNGTLEYSLDDGATWNTYTQGMTLPEIYSGDSIMWSGELSPSSDGIGVFHSTGEYTVDGNIMSLLHGNYFIDETQIYANSFKSLFSESNLVNAEHLILPSLELESECYMDMFAECEMLTKAPALPATTLATGCYKGMFRECSSLTSAPSLPAADMAESCYESMFEESGLLDASVLLSTNLAPSCYKAMFKSTRLTTAPELPATELEESCYESMFMNTNLSLAPSLPATTLAESCYESMFEGSTLQYARSLSATNLAPSCYKAMFKSTNLSSAPELPATTLAESCYESMFEGSYLMVAPELPATTLAPSCYKAMFKSTNISNAPELEATELEENCYESMFENTGLIEAPLLPATELVSGCYVHMFRGCVNLNHVIALFITDIDHTTEYTLNWLNNVAPTGVFEKHPAATWTRVDDSGVPLGWTISYYGVDRYLTFTATTPGSFKYERANENFIKYSINGGSWVSLSENQSTPTIQTGDKIRFKGNMRYNESTLHPIFSSTGYFSVSGNIMSLVYSDDFEDNTEIPNGTSGKPIGYLFEKAFLNCTKLVDASLLILPTLHLTAGLYWGMFQGCTSLTTAPAIRATTMSEGCCRNMFRGCTSLKTSPSLPASVLYYASYQQMFMGCTSLESIPSISATDLDTYSCYRMFMDCTSLETPPALSTVSIDAHGCEEMFVGCTSLTEAPSIPATTVGLCGCSGMFSGCTSLTTLPQSLPATNLGHQCYYGMFSGCTSLTSIPSAFLPATTLGPICYEGMFRGCTSLTSIPSTLLPATNLTDGCYYHMFQDCTSLTSIPSTLLPATTLAANCYEYMFMGCSGLTSIPSGLLHSTTLANYCYHGMFSNCTNITSIPSTLLPATTLTPSCYQGMFYGCTSLTSIPSGLLPSTNLATECYSGMFQGCTSLTTVPASLLPATTLVLGCYISMFYGCTSLTAAPELPALHLVSSCYKLMFYGCSSLNYVKALFVTNIVLRTPPTTQQFTDNWLYGVSQNGTFVKSIYAIWDVRGEHAVPTNWNVTYNVSSYSVPFALIPKESTTFYFPKDVECSLDQGNTWTSLSAGTNSPTVEAYDSISVRCVGTSFNGLSVEDPKDFEVVGNVMSLLYGENYSGETSLAGKEGAFSNLFYYNSHIISAERLALPATTLAANCYKQMFYNCQKLTTSPLLPATTLDSSCYYQMYCNCKSLTKVQSISATTFASYSCEEMFRECTSLTDVHDIVIPSVAKCSCRKMFWLCTGLTVPPTLSATTMADSCYINMFYGCTSLTTAPELPATTLAPHCYESMFYGCTGLVTAPQSLPATTLDSSCYGSMFSGCTSLTTAPALPATTLVSYCYSNMFNGCTSLTTAPALPATTLDSYCYSNMFRGCTSLTTLPQSLPATNLVNRCYYGMFSGCTSLTSIPSNFLPATTLIPYCYNGMFSNCTSLTTPPTLPATTMASYCYWYMFSGCTSLTTAPTLPATTLDSYCYSSMFNGCTSLTTPPALPATTLALNCYTNMFSGCTSLTTAPTLPATVLDGGCYESMFYGCTSLTTAPDLPATKLKWYCYKHMFYGCTNLNYVKAMFTTDIQPSVYTDNWVNGVASSGTFVMNRNATWYVRGVSGIPDNWTIQTATS